MLNFEVSTAFVKEGLINEENRPKERLWSMATRIAKIHADRNKFFKSGAHHPKAGMHLVS